MRREGLVHLITTCKLRQGLEKGREGIEGERGRGREGEREREEGRGKGGGGGGSITSFQRVFNYCLKVWIISFSENVQLKLPSMCLRIFPSGC